MSLLFNENLERLVWYPIHRHISIIILYMHTDLNNNQDDFDDEPLLAYARARMREAEDDFLYTGRAFLSLLASNPWSRLSGEDPTLEGSLTERILKSLCCAEKIEIESAIDPVKLTMARILLHHHFEQKCIELSKDPKISSYLFQGKGIASVTINTILEEIYNRHDQNISAQAKEKRLSRFMYHKRIGKRWSFVVSHLGLGIVLTCGPELATHV
ncbi:hypothetical protein EJ07DRAFT_135507 [Lizonia empirigonia]|nr:hypothetical protein EJ07DRAFT_135507 [Lizonia empirigonia]